MDFRMYQIFVLGGVICFANSHVYLVSAGAIPVYSESMPSGDKQSHQQLLESRSLNTNAKSSSDSLVRRSTKYAQNMEEALNMLQTTSKSERDLSHYLESEREIRQVAASTSLDTLAPLLQNALNTFIDISTLFFSNLWTYSLTNLAMPESMNTLIPIRSGDLEEMATPTKVREVATVSSNTPSVEEIDKILSVLNKLTNHYEKIKAYLKANEGAADLGENAHIQSKIPSVMNVSTITNARELLNSVTGNKKVDIKVRRKREIVENFQPDANLTQIAGMVLSAIQSGECMQKSICLLGNRIGNSNKGRVAFTLVDKLVPESVHENQYFTTLKKVLKGGERFCHRFRCNYK